MSLNSPSDKNNKVGETPREEITFIKEAYLHSQTMFFSCYSVFFLIISSLISITSAAICYECSSPINSSNCSLIDSTTFNALGCLIEFEDPDDTGLRVRRITKFCPNNFTECKNLVIEKSTWLTFVWKMHNPNTKQPRKNPILNMWYECFHDKCNNPEYIKSLVSVNVRWNVELLENKSIKEPLNTQCYTCNNQTIPFVCTSLNTCENGCKMQGYRISTNPVASRLLTIFNVRYWQPQCNYDLKEYQSSNYSINGYIINNLNSKNQNMAIEAYCLRDNCNQLDVISEIMNNVSISFESEPWFPSNDGMKQTVETTFLHSISALIIAKFIIV